MLGEADGQLVGYKDFLARLRAARGVSTDPKKVTFIAEVSDEQGWLDAFLVPAQLRGPAQKHFKSTAAGQALLTTGEGWEKAYAVFEREIPTFRERQETRSYRTMRTPRVPRETTAKMPAHEAASNGEKQES